MLLKGDEKMEKPSYYAILPADVRYDNRLKPMEKIIYCEITALTNKNGYCNARNSYFAELYEVHKNTVGAWISHLVELGYLKSILIYKENSSEIIGRKLYISIPKKETDTPINENIDTPQQKNLDPINENIDTLSTKKLKINNTSLILQDEYIEREEEQPEETEKPKETLNTGMYFQEIKMLLSGYSINYEKIARYGKPIERIRAVIKFAKENNRAEGWITEAIRDDYKLEVYKKPQSKKIKDVGRQQHDNNDDNDKLYEMLGI